MTPGLMDFRGPMGFRKAVGFKVRISVKIFFFGNHLISTGKIVTISVETSFFFDIISFFEPNYSIFSVYFGLHKTGNLSCLSWLRAHFWSPAALPDGKVKISSKVHGYFSLGLRWVVYLFTILFVLLKCAT